MNGIEAGEKWKQHKRRLYGEDLSGFQLWMEDLRSRHQRDLDALVAVTGKRREGGKSTFARKLARRLDPGFEIRRQCCFSFKEVRAVSEELEPGQVIVWDEIIEGGMAREWNTTKNKDMEKFFTISGDLNLITMVLAPHIDMFDNSLRRAFFTDWVLKPSRTWAKIHTAGYGGDYPGRQRPWADVCLVRCTADSAANDQEYRAKKDQARRLIGQEESTAPELDVARLDAAAAGVPFSES